MNELEIATATSRLNKVKDNNRVISAAYTKKSGGTFTENEEEGVYLSLGTLLLGTYSQ